MESYSRIRSVKLKRSTPDHPFGFSVRGGHEHGTGIFVSSVEPHSCAHRQGLKVGDQILRVNGYPVSAAVHHECLSLMRIRSSLHLKVRSVGMLPVKEKINDPLTWKLVEEQLPSCSPELNHSSIEMDRSPRHRHHRHQHHTYANENHNHVPHSHPHVPLISRMSDTSSQPDSRTEFNGTEAKIFIDTSGQSGLGCCICKGPPERPGIFVQSTKSNGIARDAGLRPGDQILSCNGHSFLHIPFAEAVCYLKSSKHLSLLVLKGAASDLFPGESSGYNSSASSLNGDTHASCVSGTSDSSTSSPADIIVHDLEQSTKRLSMVTEELPLQEPLAAKRTENGKDTIWSKGEKETIIIEVKGEDPITRIRNEEEKLLEERRKLEDEQKRLMKEAFQLEEEKRKFEEEKRRSLEKTSTTSVSSNPNSIESTNSLAGALTQEILKRNERRENNLQNGITGKEEERPKSGIVQQKKNIFASAFDTEVRQHHDQLIEEFKRAHRKMFAHTLEEESPKCQQDDGDEGKEPVIRAKRMQKEIDHERKMVAERVVGIVRQRQLRIERQYQELEETEREVSQHVVRNKSPPPPPPMPPQKESAKLEAQSSKNVAPQESTDSKGSTVKTKGHGPGQDVAQPSPAGQKSAVRMATKTSGGIQGMLVAKNVIIEKSDGSSKNDWNAKQSIKPALKRQAPNPPTATASPAKPMTVKYVDTSNAEKNTPNRTTTENEVMTENPQNGEKPPSPTPDYSNSPSPVPSPPRPRTKQIGVDMQSLESFRLRDPPKGNKKPPPVYFNNPNHPSNQRCQARMSAYPAIYSSSGDDQDDGESGAKYEKIESSGKYRGMGHDVKVNIINGKEINFNEPLDNERHSFKYSKHKSYHHNPTSKPNGGILKLTNGSSSSSITKTISFGGKF